jgi:hypothetical protein
MMNGQANIKWPKVSDAVYMNNVQTGKAYFNSKLINYDVQSLKSYASHCLPEFFVLGNQNLCLYIYILFL